MEGAGPRAEPSHIKLLHKVICKNKKARCKRLGHTLVNFSAKYIVNKLCIYITDWIKLCAFAPSKILIS